jgi:ABC-2 type transport system permease protein
MLLFGYAVSLDVKKVPVAVLDRDKSQESISFIYEFIGSPYFYLKNFTKDESEIKKLIDHGEIKMGIIIPWDFSKLIKSGRKPQVSVLIDGTDSNTANIILNYAQAISNRYNQEKTFLKIERLSGKRPKIPLEGRTRVWFNEEMESKNYFIPGLVAVIMSIIGVLLTGQVIVREWERGTMELLISTPINKVELIIGKLFPYFFIGLVDLFLAFFMGRFIFEVPFRGSHLLLFSLSSIYLIVALALGMTISTIAKTQIFANQLAMIIGFLPTFLLSGFTFVISNMPYWLQIITYLIAPRYYVTISKEIFLKGSNLKLLILETLILIGMAIGGILVAISLFKKELR